MNANKVYGVTEETLLEAAELLEVHSSGSGSREWFAAESIREILAIDPWATAENVIGGLRCELDSMRMALVTVRDGRDGWRQKTLEARADLSQAGKRLYQAKQKITSLLYVVKESSDYLDGSVKNQICCESILHRKMKDSIAIIQDDDLCESDPDYKDRVIERQRNVIASLRAQLVDSYSIDAITPPEDQAEYSAEQHPIRANHLSIGSAGYELGYVVDPEKKP